MKISRGFGLVGATLVVASALSCSSDKRSESVAQSSEALSTTERILSFEQVATDWTPIDGTVASSNVHVDGAHSGAFTATGWNGQLVSPKLSSLGPIASTASVEFELPANVAGIGYQGQISLVVDAPSVGVFQQHTNPVQFQNAPVGSFQHVQFALSSAVVSALSTSNYTDLQLTLILGVAPNSQPFLVDKLNFGQAAQSDGGAGAGGVTGAGASTGTGGTAGGATGAGGASGSTSSAGGVAGSAGGGVAGAGGGAAGNAGGGAAGSAGSGNGAGTSGASGGSAGGGGTTTGTSGPCTFAAPSSGGPATDVGFTIKLPHGVHREDVGIATSGPGFFRLDDGVRVVRDAGGFASVSSVEAFIRPELGVGAEAQDVYSEPTGIDLRSNAHVHGIVKTASNLTKQAGALVDGSVSENVSLQPFDTIEWTVAFPNANRGSCNLEPDSAEVIDPGSYGDIAIKSRSHLKIRSGTYYFHSLSFEPESVLDIDNTSGPVFIYVRTDFSFGGTVVEADPGHMNFLFGVAGANDIAIQSPFRGILVAPLAGVNLPTEGAIGHVGSFFMRAVIAHQNTLIHQRPFLPSEFCASDAACSSFCPCGTCTPNCGNKQCGDDLGDGCGGTCPAVCGGGQVGCASDSDCQSGLLCRGFVAGATAPTVCTVPDCLSNPRVVGCGFEGAPCGPSCTRNPECFTDADCPSGHVCGIGNGFRYGVPTANVCELPGCETSPTALGCGSTQSVCGLCACTPNCAGKHCGDADLSDGCGSTCPSTCTDGNPAGCGSNVDCQPGSYCALGQGARVGLPANSNVCLPQRCAVPVETDCGTLLSTCGLCPSPTDSCVGRECGTDPVTGESCGNACGNDQFCSAAGTCVSTVVTPPIKVIDGNTTRAIVTPASPPAPGFGATPGSFAVTSQGSASYSIPIDIPPGRHGIEPSLSLRYATSTGNGTLGIGWSLDGLSTISRCQRTYAQDGQSKPVTLDKSDPLCLDGQRLVEIAPREFRTEIDTFTKIITPGVDQAGQFFRFQASTKNGRLLTYGADQSALANTRTFADVPLIRTWALSKVADRDGNYMRIRYRQTETLESRILGIALSSTSELIPDSITYTGSGESDGDREIKFEYSDSRPDKLLGYQIGGGTLARTLRLEHIQVLANHSLVRRYDLHYETASNNASRLDSLQECAGPSSICKGATRFTYTSEQGFDSGTAFTPPIVDPNLDSGAPEFFAPYGTPLSTMGGYDVLTTESNNATAIPTQPIPGGADMAVQVIPIGGQIAGAIIDLVNMFGASSYQQDWFVRVFNDFKKNSFSFGGRCSPRDRAKEHVVRNLLGAESIYDTCPGETLTWFVDVDGDGVQDRLQCSHDGKQVEYYLARNHLHQIPKDISTIPTPDSTVAVFPNLCASEENWAAWAASPIALPPSSAPPRPPFIAAFDVDGDGTGNLLVKDDTGWSALFFDGVAPEWRRLSTELVPLRLEQRYVAFLDANGDGLRDILALPGVETPNFPFPFLWLNTGEGFKLTFLGADSKLDIAAPGLPAYVVDYDHDGVDDLIEPSFDHPPDCNVFPGDANVIARLNCLTALQKWNEDAKQPHPWIIRHFNNGRITKETLPDTGPGYPGALGDFDGDGNLDLVTRKPDSSQYFMHHGSGRLQNALKTVIDGFDRRVDVQYDITNTEGDQTYTPAQSLHPGDKNTLDDNGTECQWPNSCPRKIDHLLVSSYQESHRETAGAFLMDSDIRLSYHGEVVDAGGLGKFGFMSRLTTVRDVAGSLRGQTRWTSVAIPSSASSLPPIEAPYQRTVVGLPSSVLEKAPHAASALISAGLTDNFQATRTDYSWGQQTSDNGARPFAVLLKKKTTVSELAPTGFTIGQDLYEQSDTFAVDGFGNTVDHTITRVDIDRSDPFNPTPAAGSVSTYNVHDTFNPTAAEISDWLISLVKSEDATDQPRCNGGAVSCPSESRSRHVDYTYYPTGTVKQVTRAAGDATAQVQTSFARDIYGNVVQVTEIDAAGDVRTAVSFFDERGMFPTVLENRLGQITQVRYDDRFGKLTVRVDPNSIPETWSYDDFGVLRDYRGPSGEEKTDYEPDGTTSAVGMAVMAKYRVTRQQVGGGTTVERYNSLNQLVARENSGLNGATVVEELGYDQRDRLQLRSRPHLPNDATQGLIQLGYDEQDRVTSETYPNGSVVHHDHALVSSLSSNVRQLLPSAGGVISVARTTDANGNSTYLFANRDGQTVEALDASNHATSYTYGAFGKLEQIVGPNGTLSYSFDSYGRMLTSADAAVGGERTISYNGLDEIVSSRDPAGRNSTIFYDELGRQKRLETSDGTSTWTYDQGTNAIGRLSGTVSPSGQQLTYAYEPPTNGTNRGLLASVTQSLVSPVATTSTVPTVLTTAYHYDAFSRLEQIDYPSGGATPFGVKYGFDSSGHVVSVSNAADSNSVYWQLTGSDQGYRPSQEILGNGAVTERHYEALTGHLSSITTRHEGHSIQELGYGYDPNGNLTQRTNLISGLGESFAYDSLNRVSSASSSAPTSETFTYDPISNALSRQDHVGDYTYYPEGRDWVKSAGETQYTHDALGNIETRSGPSVPGTTQEFTYTTFDLPTHVSFQNAPTGGVDFAYDASGSRVVKQTNAGTTFYANDLYQRIEPSAGGMNQRFMIYAGGRAIAAVSQQQGSTSATIEYMHDDALGSVQTTTATDASVVASRQFDTFGDARGTLTNTAQMPYGYTGQEQDSELGLVNMHGRLYDPQLGQFMSPDPVVQSLFSQGLNRFAYAFNSPLNFTDPSGFSAEASEDIAIGVGAAYFGGLAVHLLTSGGAVGVAAVEGTTAGASAAVAGGGAAVATAGAASVGAIAQAAGAGAGVAGSFAANVLMSGRQAVSTMVTAQPSTRTASAAGTGPSALGRTSYATMGTSPAQEPSQNAARPPHRQWDPNEPVFCGAPGSPTCVLAPAPDKLTPVDHIARFFVAQHAVEVQANQEEVGTSIDSRRHRLSTHKVDQGGPDGVDISYNPDTAVAMVHLHPGEYEEALTFSGKDINTANAAWDNHLTEHKVLSYVSVNKGQYILRYDPEQYTITFLPGVWGQVPGGFIP